MDARVARRQDLPDLCPVLAQALELVRQNLALVSAQIQLLPPVRRKPLCGAPDVNQVRVLKLVAAHAQAVQPLVLNLLRGHAVLAVQELDNVANRVAHSAVVLDLHILHRLHQAALDVTRLGRLDGCVDETLAAAHGVEKELLRR